MVNRVHVRYTCPWEVDKDIGAHKGGSDDEKDEDIDYPLGFDPKNGSHLLFTLGGVFVQKDCGGGLFCSAVLSSCKVF